MSDVFFAAWPYVVAVSNTAICIAASAHAVMYRRDTRAVIAWVGVIWLVPFVGAALYSALGINRIRRRAHTLRGDATHSSAAAEISFDHECGLESCLADEHAHLMSLSRLVGALTMRPLLAGNRVLPLKDGDQAYPEMIRAIDEAERSITLSTYIFDNDRTGELFLDALVRAKDRGVEVRILIDDVGARYSRPPMDSRLMRSGLRVSRFLPLRLPRMFHYANLRNHRKILVVDGRIGFTGGMNIREGNQVQSEARHPISDLHFRIDGPVIAHLQDVFVSDWHFCTGEALSGEPWFPKIPSCGPVLARGIADGPDEDFEKLQLALLGALATARHSVDIVTPYFLPDASIITALNVASLRGVDVRIVLPERNNIVLVQWATDAILWQVLERGCRVWKTPPPFDHTKLMVVDNCWSLLGSTNWDPRSLRLNFEFNLECFNCELAQSLTQLVECRIECARETRAPDLEKRTLPVRLRDGTANLFSPYL